MNSIIDFPLIRAGINEQEEAIRTLQLTVDKLEETIARPEYALTEAFRIEGSRNRKTVDEIEKVTGFGNHLSNMFETLTDSIGRIPTQAEFNAACMEVLKEFWEVEDPVGIPWCGVVEQALSNRNFRTYLAQMNELHCLLLLKEMFPEWDVYSSDDLDLLMGVDIVVETDKKRIYLHLLKNSGHSFKYLKKKGIRGGRKDSQGVFKRYKRDFTGDKLLAYDSNFGVNTGVTRHVNGIPLYRREWLENQLLTFNKFPQVGEPLDHTKKLDYLESFLQSLEPELEVAA